MFPEKEKLGFPIEILLVACQSLLRGFAEGFVLSFRFERITLKERANFTRYFTLQK